MQSLRAVWRLHSGTQQQQGQQGQPPAAVAGVSMAGACTPRHQYRSLLPWCVSSATGAYRCYHVHTRPSMPSACSTLEYRRRRRARGYAPYTVRRTPIPYTRGYPDVGRGRWECIFSFPAGYSLHDPVSAVPRLHRGTVQSQWAQHCHFFIHLCFFETGVIGEAPSLLVSALGIEWWRLMTGVTPGILWLMLRAY
eukprot:COSAG02_NODE_9507_length_2194_cov_2.879634_2_plen_195_part_00